MIAVVIGFFGGILTGFLCWQGISVSYFIQNVESGCECEKCVKKNCFAKKKIFADFTILDEWILIGYYGVSGYCRFARNAKWHDLVKCIIWSIILLTLFFWSGKVSFVTLLFGICVAMLCALSVVDWNTEYIPLECNMVIFFCGLIHLFADISNWLEYAIGLIAVSGFLCIVNWIATPILRKKYAGEQEIDCVIGDGDIKLMAATGLLLGWKLNFLALGIGCVLGSIIHLIFMKIKGSEGKFALGPYLSLGVYITMICGKQLVSWYLNTMGIMPY